MDYLVKPTSNSISDILKAFYLTLKNYYVRGERYQRFTYIIGLFLIIAGLFHVIPLAFSGFAWNGAVSFRKPIVFGLALGLNAWSFAWIMTYLPKLKKTSWTILIIYLTASILEFIPITWQAWRGLPSHFNTLDPLSAFFWMIMGNAVIGLVITVVAMTFWGMFWLKAPSNYKIAIKVGLLILLFGQGLGGWIISNAAITGGENPEALLQQEGGFEDASTYGEAGNMKLPHFLALHAVQFLPLLAIFTQFTLWKERRKKNVLWLASAGYVGLMSVVLFQVFNGLTLFDLNVLSGSILFGTVGLIIIPIVYTYFGVRKRAY